MPYERGDLLNRVHEHGEVVSLEHTGDGTLLQARVNEDLAGELAAYATERPDHRIVAILR